MIDLHGQHGQETTNGKQQRSRMPWTTSVKAITRALPSVKVDRSRKPISCRTLGRTSVWVDRSENFGFENTPHIGQIHHVDFFRVDGFLICMILLKICPVGAVYR